jgi:hypothetical protein
MALYSKRLANKFIPATAGKENLFTVAPGSRVVIRDVTACRKGTGVGYWFISDAATSINAVAGATSDNGIGHWTGRQVFSAGRTARFSTSGGSWSITVCGYSLSAP